MNYSWIDELYLPPKYLASLVILCAVLFSGGVKCEPLRLPSNNSQIQVIENIISNYLKKNPEIIIEALEVMRNREKDARKLEQQKNIKKSRELLLYDATSPVIGNPNGDITIVEFFDYRCGYCKKVFSVIPALLKHDKMLRFVFKELPILSKESEIAARAALVVWNFHKKKYFQFHKALMETRSPLTELNILRIASKLKIDTSLVREEMYTDKIDNILLQNQILAKKLGIQGTPVFIIRDKIIPGAVDLLYIKKLISEIRKNV